MTDEMLERVCIMRDKWVRVYLRLCMCMADVECRDGAMDTCIQGHGSRDAMTLCGLLPSRGSASAGSMGS